MTRTVRFIGISMIATFLVLSAGCSTDSAFVYKPNPPGPVVQALPLNVAVLPFTDGTEDFTFRGSVFSDGQYNLGKAGVAGGMNALPPEIWGKSFADELAASGRFRSVRFAYDASELRDEDLLVEGVLKKAVYAAKWDSPNEILVSFRAARRSGGKPVWEKEAGVVWNDRPKVSPACSLNMNCLVGKMHEDWNGRMNGVFAEARADLEKTLASASGSGAAKPEGRPLGSTGESVDRTIENILKGK